MSSLGTVFFCVCASSDIAARIGVREAIAPHALSTAMLAQTPKNTVPSELMPPSPPPAPWRCRRAASRGCRRPCKPR